MQFRNGSAYNGGAIANTCGNILIDNCIFKNNIATYTEQLFTVLEQEVLLQLSLLLTVTSPITQQVMGQSVLV